MKVITNAYDMDAAENMWVKKYGNPHKRSLGGKVMKLTNGQNFSMDAYREAQGNGTNWMVSRSPAMMDFIRHRGRHNHIVIHILRARFPEFSVDAKLFPADI